MKSLKFEEQIVRFVEFNDLDKFIKDHLNQNFDCVSSEEWRNDSKHRFKVKPITDSYQLDIYNKFKNNDSLNKNFILSAILNGLCTDGLLEAGIYIICVCW